MRVHGNLGSWVAPVLSTGMKVHGDLELEKQAWDPTVGGEGNPRVAAGARPEFMKLVGQR